MSKYDADKIVRNLSSVNKIMEPMNKFIEPMASLNKIMEPMNKTIEPIVSLNKNFVNYDELLGISKLSKFCGELDREFIALACEPITPTRGRIVNNTYNIDSKNVQIGDHNTQNVTINVQKLVEAIAESNDHEAKSMLKSLLENSTVASVIGAGVSSLISLI